MAEQLATKHIRIDTAFQSKLTALLENSKMTESELIRTILWAGADALESGTYNPFAPRSQTSVVREDAPEESEPVNYSEESPKPKRGSKRSKKQS